MKFSNVFGIVVLASILVAASFCVVPEEEADAIAIDSGDAAVQDANEFLKKTIGDDVVKVNYSWMTQTIEVFFDAAYFSGLSANTAEAKAIAFDILKNYNTVEINDVAYVSNGMPNVAGALSGFVAIAGTVVDKVAGAEPGVTVVYSTSDVVIDKKGYLPFTGNIVVKAGLDEKTIGFGNYVSEYVDFDSETGAVNVNLDLFGADDEMSVKDVIGALKNIPADKFFDPEYAGMINTVIDTVNRVPNAVNAFSVSWTEGDKTYQAALSDFKPGVGGDAFQNLMTGIYNGMTSTEGYENGWEAPFGTFKDAETGSYVFNGDIGVTYYTDSGDVQKSTTHLSGDVKPAARSYKVTIEESENGIVSIVPGLTADKVNLVAIPAAGCTLSSLVVVMDGVETDITASKSFNLTADAVVKAVFKKSVTGITLNAETLSIQAGTTGTLTATVVPADASDKSVVWTTSDDKIATVANGVVTGVAAGTATITATTVDGGFKATCAVTVTEAPVIVKVDGITLHKTFDKLKVGETGTITATVSPENATNKNVIWSSSDTKVATVNGGVVKAVGEGKVTITATAEDGGVSATTGPIEVVAEHSSGSDNTLLYIGIVLAIIIILLIVFFIMRSRSKA